MARSRFNGSFDDYNPSFLTHAIPIINYNFGSNYLEISKISLKLHESIEEAKFDFLPTPIIHLLYHLFNTQFCEWTDLGQTTFQAFIELGNLIIELIKLWMDKDIINIEYVYGILPTPEQKNLLVVACQQIKEHLFPASEPFGYLDDWYQDIESIFPSHSDIYVMGKAHDFSPKVDNNLPTLDFEAFRQSSQKTVARKLIFQFLQKAIQHSTASLPRSQSDQTVGCTFPDCLLYNLVLNKGMRDQYNQSHIMPSPNRYIFLPANGVGMFVDMVRNTMGYVEDLDESTMCRLIELLEKLPEFGSAVAQDQSNTISADYKADSFLNNTPSNSNAFNQLFSNLNPLANLTVMNNGKEVSLNTAAANLADKLKNQFNSPLNTLKFARQPQPKTPASRNVSPSTPIGTPNTNNTNVKFSTPPTSSSLKASLSSSVLADIYDSLRQSKTSLVSRLTLKDSGIQNRTPSNMSFDIGDNEEFPPVLLDPLAANNDSSGDDNVSTTPQRKISSLAKPDKSISRLFPPSQFEFNAQLNEVLCLPYPDNLTDNQNTSIKNLELKEDIQNYELSTNDVHAFLSKSTFKNGRISNGANYLSENEFAQCLQKHPPLKSYFLRESNKLSSQDNNKDLHKSTIIDDKGKLHSPDTTWYHPDQLAKGIKFSPNPTQTAGPTTNELFDNIELKMENIMTNKSHQTQAVKNKSEDSNDLFDIFDPLNFATTNLINSIANESSIVDNAVKSLVKSQNFNSKSSLLSNPFQTDEKSLMDNADRHEFYNRIEPNLIDFDSLCDYLLNMFDHLSFVSPSQGNAITNITYISSMLNDRINEYTILGDLTEISKIRRAKKLINVIARQRDSFFTVLSRRVDEKRAYCAYLRAISDEILTESQNFERQLVLNFRQYLIAQNRWLSAIANEFMLRHGRSLELFLKEFKNLPTPDEKTLFINDFGEKIRSQLPHYFPSLKEDSRSGSPSGSILFESQLSKNRPQPYTCDHQKYTHSLLTRDLINVLSVNTASTSEDLYNLEFESQGPLLTKSWPKSFISTNNSSSDLPLNFNPWFQGTPVCYNAKPLLDFDTNGSSNQTSAKTLPKQQLILKNENNNDEDNNHCNTKITALWVHVKRLLYSRVLEAALFPYADIDCARDELFSQHCQKLNEHTKLNPRHMHFNIPERNLTYFPWNVPQTYLKSLNLRITPAEKLHVICQACVHTCNLLSASPTDAFLLNKPSKLTNPLSLDRGSATSGSISVDSTIPDTDAPRIPTDQRHHAQADDLVPVLVYIVLSVNPIHLLSNIQYIDQYYFRSQSLVERQSRRQNQPQSTFDDSFLNEDNSHTAYSGEIGYWWTQFKSVVEYIKTMEYVEDPTSSSSNLPNLLD